MKNRRLTWAKFSVTIAAVLAVAPAGAQTLSTQDPPSRVARLNWIEGSVSFQPAGLDTWTAATLNYPLTSGDHIYTDNNSRAEMHVGPNAIRLSPFSNFGYTNLDDRTVQVRFTEGAMEIRLRNLADDDLYEIDTPQGAITLLRGGDYRIDCDPERNATMVTVRAGEVEVTANGQAFPVHARQTAFFAGDDQPDIRDANAPDDFDRFTGDRNRIEERPRQPQQYVPTSMVGSEDLYSYGQWRSYPEYGSVWVPPARAGWAPYRFGHWAWVEPWGWTWIDDAPWGFAPFHYGRWAHVDVGWIWVPGPLAVRPVYAPALVAFVGGPHFGLSISIGGGGGVAWFPLGPQEVYRPSYHVSNNYVNQVNVTNVTNIKTVNITNVNVTNVRYVNQNVPGAMTAVPQNAFVSRQPVHQAMQQVTPQQAAQAQVVGAAPPVAPLRASLVGTAQRDVPHPGEALMQRQVVAKQTPPPAPVSFQARQQALAQNPGRPVDPQAMQSLRAQQLRSQPAAQTFRPASVPAPASRPVEPARPFESARPAQPGRPMTPQNVAPAPVPQPRPAERMDSRPPTARPLAPPQPQQPQYETNPNRPEMPRPEAVRPEPQPRPLAQPQPRPETARPVENTRPIENARPSQRPEAQPAPREAQPAPRKDQRRPENREPKQNEKKDPPK